jgi:hypothetical protein
VNRNGAIVGRGDEFFAEVERVHGKQTADACWIASLDHDEIRDQLAIVNARIDQNQARLDELVNEWPALKSY